MGDRMLRFLLLLPLSLTMTLINYLCAPLIALFLRDDWTLPRWLSWFATTDARMNGRGTFPGGGGGDAGFYAWSKGRNPWWVCVRWLWRNPTNGFDEAVLGARYADHPRGLGNAEMELPLAANPHLFRIKHYGLRSLVDMPFEIYWKWRWRRSRYVRVRIGWKLTGQDPAQYVFVPHPFKPIK